METIGTVVQTVGLLVMAIAFGWGTVSIVRDFDDIGLVGTLIAVLMFGGASIACGFGFLYYASQFGNLWLHRVQWINALYEHTSSLADRVRQLFDRYVLPALLIVIGTILSVVFGKLSITFGRAGSRRGALFLAAIAVF